MYFLSFSPLFRLFLLQKNWNVWKRDIFLAYRWKSVCLKCRLIKTEQKRGWFTLVMFAHRSKIFSFSFPLSIFINSEHTNFIANDVYYKKKKKRRQKKNRNLSRHFRQPIQPKLCNPVMSVTKEMQNFLTF